MFLYWHRDLVWYLVCNKIALLGIFDSKIVLDLYVLTPVELLI